MAAFHCLLHFFVDTTQINDLDLMSEIISPLRDGKIHGEVGKVYSQSTVIQKACEICMFTMK